MKTYNTGIQHCPYCNKELEKHSSFENSSGPRNGDVSICIGCYGILIFDESLTLVKPTDKQIEELMSDKEFLKRYTKLSNALREVRKDKN